MIIFFDRVSERCRGPRRRDAPAIDRWAMRSDPATLSPSHIPAATTSPAHHHCLARSNPVPVPNAAASICHDRRAGNDQHRLIHRRLRRCRDQVDGAIQHPRNPFAATHRQRTRCPQRRHGLHGQTPSYITQADIVRRRRPDRSGRKHQRQLRRRGRQPILRRRRRRGFGTQATSGNSSIKGIYRLRIVQFATKPAATAGAVTAAAGARSVGRGNEAAFATGWVR